MNLLSWLQNPWVVGVGGGILSGLAVNFISRFFLSKRDSREYRQKVSTANAEVLYAIRAGIPENILPSIAVVEALTSSTAREYAVDVKDLYTPKQLGESLIKQVMDSTFLSPEIKQQFCARILEALIQSPIQVIEAEKTALSQRETYRTSASRLATALGLFTTLFSILATSVLFLNSFDGTISFSTSLSPWLIPAFTAAIVLISSAAVTAAQRRQKLERIDSIKHPASDNKEDTTVHTSQKVDS